MKGYGFPSPSSCLPVIIITTTYKNIMIMYIIEWPYNLLHRMDTSYKVEMTELLSLITNKEVIKSIVL